MRCIVTYHEHPEQRDLRVDFVPYKNHWQLTFTLIGSLAAISIGSYQQLSVKDPTNAPNVVYPCPFPKNCIAAANQSCAEGATGPVCAVCKPGWRLNVDVCQECESGGFSVDFSADSNAIVALLVLLLIVALLLGYVLKAYLRRRARDASRNLFELFCPTHQNEITVEDLRAQLSALQGASEMEDVLDPDERAKIAAVAGRLERTDAIVLGEDKFIQVACGADHGCVASLTKLKVAWDNAARAELVDEDMSDAQSVCAEQVLLDVFSTIPRENSSLEFAVDTPVFREWLMFVLAHGADVDAVVAALEQRSQSWWSNKISWEEFRELMWRQDAISTRRRMESIQQAMHPCPDSTTFAAAGLSLTKKSPSSSASRRSGTSNREVGDLNLSPEEFRK